MEIISGLDGSQEELEAEYGRVHRDCIDLVAGKFPLFSRRATPIPVTLAPTDRELDTHVFGQGVFRYEPQPEIFFTRDHQDHLDATFTVAHETGHYLHFLVNSDFFHRNRDRFGGHRNIVKELVADRVAWDYLRKIGKAECYFDFIKEKALRLRQEIESDGESLAGSLNNGKAVSFIAYHAGAVSGWDIRRLSSIRTGDYRTLAKFRQQYNDFALDLVESL